jgi:hypothetical protein
MLLKNIETGYSHEVITRIFEQSLKDSADEFEFISGTKEEKKLFNENFKAMKTLHATEEEIEKALIFEEEKCL